LPTLRLTVSLAAQVPGLNSVIGMINNRRQKNAMIWGVVLGLMAVILLWQVFG
jgi:Golgi SNAP receptor complex protein 1